MTMDFNFKSLATTDFSSPSISYLKPYNIYNVCLSKIEQTTLNSKTGETFPIVAVEFKGVGEDSGIFTSNIFIPRNDSDFERRENPTSHKAMPSSFDQFQFTLMQMVEAINPKGAQTIKDNASKLKTIDQFIGLVIKALTNKSDVNVFLKLIGQKAQDGRWFARLPNACLIGQDGNPASLAFINPKRENLNFSAYEMSRAKEYQNAKPTPMKDDESNPDSNQENLDIEDLAESLDIE